MPEAARMEAAVCLLVVLPVRVAVPPSVKAVVLRAAVRAAVEISPVEAVCRQHRAVQVAMQMEAVPVVEIQVTEMQTEAVPVVEIQVTVM